MTSTSWTPTSIVEMTSAIQNPDVNWRMWCHLRHYLTSGKQNPTSINVYKLSPDFKMCLTNNVRPISVQCSFTFLFPATSINVLSHSSSSFKLKCFLISCFPTTVLAFWIDYFNEPCEHWRRRRETKVSWVSLNLNAWLVDGFEQKFCVLKARLGRCKISLTGTSSAVVARFSSHL